MCIGTGQSLSSPHGWDWAILLGISLFPGTLGHLLTNWAHPHLPVFVISIMLLGVPLVACVGAALFLGEWLTPTQIAGGAVVLIAMAAIVARQPRRGRGSAGRERRRNRRAVTRMADRRWPIAPRRRRRANGNRRSSSAQDRPIGDQLSAIGAACSRRARRNSITGGSIEMKMMARMT